MSTVVSSRNFQGSCLGMKLAATTTDVVAGASLLGSLDELDRWCLDLRAFLGGLGGGGCDGSGGDGGSPGCR